MGKNTRNFRQSKRSLSGSRGAQTYAQINRFVWHEKILRFFKVKGKPNG